MKEGPTQTKKAGSVSPETPQEGQNEGNTFLSPSPTNGKNISPADILGKVQGDALKATAKKNNSSLFSTKPVNDWVNEAKLLDVPNMLFSEFWFETDLCILFGDTNTGKSILAVQIADSVSRGEAVSGFKMGAEAKRVLYCDFELTLKQFEHRYSNNYAEHYIFSNKFLRAEINPEAEQPREFSNFEEYLLFELERTISENGTQVLIVDNITYLRNGTETAKDALPLMKMLKHLKSKHNLSILVLAHTPKRDTTKPLTRNDLQGSKMLINFCDSSFAIGESTREKGLRYVKQIKSRFTEIIYDAENVSLCRIAKPSNFLGFEQVGYGSEYMHLKNLKTLDHEEQLNEVHGMRETGLSLREIARRFGVAEGTVRYWVKQQQDETEVPF